MSIERKNLYYWGVFLSFISALLWSTTFIGTRFLLSKNNINPLVLSSFRFIIAGSLLFFIALFTRRKKLFSLTIKTMFSLVMLSLAGITGMGLFLFYGLQRTTAMNGTIILSITPFLIMIIGVIIGEKVTLRKLTGLIISLIGSMFVINIISQQGMEWGVFFQNKGNLFVFLSAASWAIYSVFGKCVVKELGGFITTTWVMIFGAIEHIIILYFTDTTLSLPTSGIEWSIILYIAIFPSALAFYAYYEAIRLTELSLVSIMQYLTPAFTILLAVILLREDITYLNILGIIIICIGIIISATQFKFKFLRKRSSRFGNKYAVDIRS